MQLVDSAIPTPITLDSSQEQPSVYSGNSHSLDIGRYARLFPRRHSVPVGSRLVAQSGLLDIMDQVDKFRAGLSGNAYPLSTEGGTAEEEASGVSSRERFVGDRAVNVMVVEDDEVDRKLYHRMLRSEAGYVLHEFVSATEALGALDRVQPDCVLLDMQLPGCNGLEFLSQMRARERSNDPPVVMLTAYDSHGLGVHALKAGAIDFLRKEKLDPESLQRAVHRAIGELRSRRMRRRLEHAERLAAIGKLAAGVAHEVNNPAAAIMINLDIIEQRLKFGRAGAEVRLSARTSEELQEIIGECQEGLRRIADIVSEMRTLSAGRLGGVASVTLDEIVATVRRLLMSQIKSCRRVDFELGTTESFFGDRGKLLQVVTNLLVNALHAAGSGGYVRVSTRQVEEEIYLLVEDDGPGVAEDLRVRIFDPFFTTKSDEKGIGLGLALSASYVGRHNGSIEVEDSPLGGALFRMRLPVATGLTPRPARVRPFEMPTTGPEQRTQCVLIVDDESTVLRAFSRSLRDHYLVLAAASIEQAEELLRQQEFAAVVCDVVMPGGGGQALYERLLQNDPKHAARFMFCTGGSLSEEVEAFLESTGVTVLRKPVDRAELAQAVAQVVGQAGVQEQA